MELVRTKHTPDQVKAMLDKAGYKGERIVLLHATDHWFFNPTGAVIAHKLAAAGMNIDEQAMDWATVQTRRTSREQLDKGGWSIFPSVVAAPDHRDPLLANFIRGNGKDGWFGWPTDPKIEQLYDDVARRHRSGGADAAGTGIPVAVVRNAAVHPAWRIPAECSLARQCHRHSEGAIGGVLERDEELTDETTQFPAGNRRRDACASCHRRCREDLDIRASVAAGQPRSGVDQRDDDAERRLHDLRRAVRPRRRHEPEAADARRLRHRGRRASAG